MRRMMFVLAMVFVAAMVSACGKSPIAPVGQSDFVMTNQATQPAAKPAVSYGVVNVTVVTLEGKEISGGQEYFLEFTQSFSDWISINYWYMGLSLNLRPGYYRARLIFKDNTGQHTEVIGEWASLPIRSSQVNTVVLTIGGQGSVGYSIPCYHKPVVDLTPDDISGPMTEGISWDIFRLKFNTSDQDLLVESVQILSLTPQVYFILNNRAGGITTADGRSFWLSGDSSNGLLYKPDIRFARIPKNSMARITVDGVPAGSGTMTLKVKIRYYFANDPFAGGLYGRVFEVEGPTKVVTIIPIHPSPPRLGKAVTGVR